METKKNQWVKHELKEEIKEYLEANTIKQNLQNATKEVLRKTFILVQCL